MPFRATWPISSDNILWIRNAIRCTSDIRLKHNPIRFDCGNQIIFNYVVNFRSILQKYGMASYIVANILLNFQILDPTKYNTSSIRVMNGVSSNKWLLKGCIRVKIERISAINCRLTYLFEFCIWDPPNWLSMNHQMTSIILFWGFSLN